MIIVVNPLTTHWMVIRDSWSRRGKSGMEESAPTLAGLCTDLPFMLKWIDGFGDPDVTLIVPVDPAGSRGATTAILRDHGWTVSAPPEDGGWWTCARGTDRLTLAVREYCPTDPIIGAGPARPTDILQSLARWLYWTGEPYVKTPGVSTLMVMREHTRGHGVWWKLQDRRTAEWWTPPANLTDLRFQEKRITGRPLHRFDMRAAYLAAMAAVELPHRRLEHTGPHPASDAVGYYRVRFPAGKPVGGLPPADRQGCHWIGHPMLRLFRGSMPLEVVDSWTTTEATRVLRTWAERWRDHLDRAELTALRPALKAGYSQAVGLMAVPRGSVYRPDWRHLIIDQVRASLCRRLANVHQLMGAVPVRVDVDSIWFSTTSSRDWATEGYLRNLSEALGVAPNVGRMRYEGLGQLQRDGARLKWVTT